MRLAFSCIFVLLLSGTSNGQLRVGSGNRTIYQDPPVREASHSLQLDEPGATSNQRLDQGDQSVDRLTGNSDCTTSRNAAVVSASHTRVSAPQGSQTTSPRRLPANRQPGTQGNAATIQRLPKKIDGSNNDAVRLASNVECDCEFSGQESTLVGSSNCDCGGEGGYETAGSLCCDSGFGPNTYFGGGVCGGGVSPLQSLWCRMSIRAEVPLFWRKGHSTPPLVTTSPAGTASDVAGVLGLPTTQILQGGEFGQDAQAGFRLTLGTYLDACQNYAVSFRYWNAGDRDDRNTFDSDEFPILARPFRNTSVANTPANDTQLVAFPGDSIGNVSVLGQSELYGLDFQLRHMLYADRFTRVDWTYGYQHAFIGERLSIGSETTVIGNLPPLQGSTISVSDRFRTENILHAGTLGLQSTRRVACFQFETLFRLGLGNLRREVGVVGSTTTTSGGTSNTVAEGLLARSTNSRTVIDSTFVIAPEVGINLAYAISPQMDFTIGYNYLMIPKVLQAGRLIDPNLEVNLSDPLTGALDPALNLESSRYWVRTLGLGLQLRY